MNVGFGAGLAVFVLASEACALAWAAFAVVLALYDSGRLGVPAVVCTVGEPLRLTGAIAAKNYYLAVDGLNGATGSIALQYLKIGDFLKPSVTRFMASCGLACTPAASSRAR